MDPPQRQPDEDDEVEHRYGYLLGQGISQLAGKPGKKGGLKPDGERKHAAQHMGGVGRIRIGEEEPGTAGLLRKLIAGEGLTRPVGGEGPAADKPEEELTVIRCCHLILAYFARLNGLPHLEERRINALDLDKADPLDEEELKELDAALQSMADGILRKGYKEIKGAALYARIIFSHPMRVLRTVRSHRPFRMVFSLGKLVFAAMAALVLALLSTELWYLGVGINTWRLIIIAMAVLLASTLYVVFRQRLYVRRVSRSLSEQAAFFNLTSFLTVFSVLLALFTIIFVVTIVVTVGVYPRYIIEDWLGKSDVGFLDYAKVSLLISSMAMVVGALGAGLEENQHFRQVMYTERNR